MQCERDACTVIDHVTMVAVFTNKIIRILSGERFFYYFLEICFEMCNTSWEKNGKNNDVVFLEKNII